MTQIKRQSGFIQKHPNETIVGGQLRQHPLDGDRLFKPFQANRDRFEYLGHASGIETFKDLISVTGLSAHV